MFDNWDKVFPASEGSRRRRKNARKYHPAHTSIHVHSHMLLHTHSGKAAIPFFSNLILVEMRWEMSCRGRLGMRSALNYKIQKQIALLSIHPSIHLQQYFSTQTRSCNLLSQRDMLLLFHSIYSIKKDTN